MKISQLLVFGFACLFIAASIDLWFAPKREVEMRRQLARSYFEMGQQAMAVARNLHSNQPGEIKVNDPEVWDAMNQLHGSYVGLIPVTNTAAFWKTNCWTVLLKP